MMFVIMLVGLVAAVEGKVFFGRGSQQVEA